MEITWNFHRITWKNEDCIYLFIFTGYVHIIYRKRFNVHNIQALVQKGPECPDFSNNDTEIEISL